MKPQKRYTGSQKQHHGLSQEDIQRKQMESENMSVKNKPLFDSSQPELNVVDFENSLFNHEELQPECETNSNFNNQEKELDQIKNINVRKSLLVGNIGLFIGDVLSIYPRFMSKKFFPNQIGIMMSAVLGWPAYVMLVVSFWKNKTSLVQPILLLTVARIQTDFWNQPGEEVG